MTGVGITHWRHEQVLVSAVGGWCRRWIGGPMDGTVAVEVQCRGGVRGDDGVWVDNSWEWRLLDSDGVVFVEGEESTLEAAKTTASAVLFVHTVEPEADRARRRLAPRYMRIAHWLYCAGHRRAWRVYPIPKRAGAKAAVREAARLNDIGMARIGAYAIQLAQHAGAPVYTDRGRVGSASCPPE